MKQKEFATHPRRLGLFVFATGGWTRRGKHTRLASQLEIAAWALANLFLVMNPNLHHGRDLKSGG